MTRHDPEADAIGLDDLAYTSRIRNPDPKRYQVYFQNAAGDTIGRVNYVKAPSVTKALEQFAVEHFAGMGRVHSAVVTEITLPGVRVPLWHTSPKWAPSSDWSDVG